MKNLFTRIPGITTILILLIVCSCTKTEKEAESYSETNEEKVSNPSKLFITVDTKEIASAKTGDMVQVSLEDGSIYRLQIRSVEETIPGILSISANIENAETGLATFILRDGKLAGSIAMYADGTNYSMAYDKESEKHYITLINPDDRDVLQGGEPLDISKSGN